MWYVITSITAPIRFITIKSDWTSYLNSLSLFSPLFLKKKQTIVISLYHVAIFSVSVFQFYNIVVILFVICRLIDCSI